MMRKALEIKVICIDDVILWFGSKESMESESGRKFRIFKFARDSIGNRLERTYHADSYEAARDEFKRELAILSYAGVFYYGWSLLENHTYYFKGYPVREKNKNSSQSR